MLYKKRKFFDDISKRIGKIFSKLSISPNQWTISSLFFILITFYFIINKEFLIATIIFIFTALVDMIDGAVARVTKRTSKLGAYLDTVIDRIIEFVIIFGLLFIDYPNFILNSRIWLFLLFFGSLMTTYVKSSAFEKKLVKKELKGGVLEHTDRLILLFLIMLISNFSFQYALYLIVLTAILANISVLQRFFIAVKG